jgi:hypothetical protein
MHAPTILGYLLIIIIIIFALPGDNQWRNSRVSSDAPPPPPPGENYYNILLVHLANRPEPQLGPENLQRIAPKSRNWRTCEIYTFLIK